MYMHFNIKSVKVFNLFKILKACTHTCTSLYCDILLRVTIITPKMYNFLFKHGLLFIFFFALFGIIQSNSEVVRSVEGDVVPLSFQYPCDSTKVTLQHSFQSPFFNSLKPNSTILPSNHILRNINGTNSKECSLKLQFNPVLRIDEGTYILTAYKNGLMLPEYPRIGLRVGYPPGEASCLVGNDDIDGEWVKLLCEAPLGHLVSGQIICYQNGMRLPSLHKPKQNDYTLSQSIQARITDPGHVRCCSSTLKETKNMCVCMDWEWDPMHRRVLTNITDPCPGPSSPSSSSQYTTDDNGINNIFTTLSSKTPHANSKSSFKDNTIIKMDSISESIEENTVLTIVVLACTALLVIVILVILYKHVHVYARKAKKNCQRDQ